jgi:FkbM family methyltransferase
MNSAELRTEIERLLEEGMEGALERERNTFDRLVGSRPLVLCGAGGMGRRALAGLRKFGTEPLAFADNNPALWGKTLDGIPVMSPRDAAGRYGATAAFVVTTWSGLGHDRMDQRIAFLRGLGCEVVTSFGPLYWKYADVFLPHYAAGAAHWVHRDAEAVLDACDLWADEASRLEYLSQVRWRLWFDFENLSNPVGHPIYFPRDICPLIENEVFVDCGAYDGDTIELFLAQPQPGFGEIVGFEPDPANFAVLSGKVSTFPRRDSVTLIQSATGSKNGTVSFSSGDGPASAVGTGSLTVQCLTLDDALQGHAPTYLKMDIEGAEPDTLIGARGIIEKHAPVLAICCYHQQDHLWSIPRLIRSLNPDYRFFLRPHVVDVWDLVCYAIPPGRLRS